MRRRHCPPGWPLSCSPLKHPLLSASHSREHLKAKMGSSSSLPTFPNHSSVNLPLRDMWLKDSFVSAPTPRFIATTHIQQNRRSLAVHQQLWERSPEQALAQKGRTTARASSRGGESDTDMYVKQYGRSFREIIQPSQHSSEPGYLCLNLVSVALLNDLGKLSQTEAVTKSQKENTHKRQ